MTSIARPFHLLWLCCVALGPAASHAVAQPADPHAGHAAAPAAQPMSMGDMREASGTAWQPSSSPASGAMWHAGEWMLMLHGNLFLQYLEGTGERGDRQLGSINWGMLMARRPLAGGQFTARVMSSLEPLTVGRCGYPDLLQTGESCGGSDLHDRQHPHDLFMEAALHYSRPAVGGLTLDLYGGLAGEPALGPVAFPHRASAMTQPLAPLSHHWLDATHVTFGVATVGLSGTRWKVEASAFNGREPDDARYGFDLARLDSVSARLWWLPTDHVAVQASTGALADAHGSEDVRRSTASVTYLRQFDGRVWATTAAWGINDDHDRRSHALLVESAIDLTAVDTAALRVEVVPRTAGELDLPGDAHGSFTVAKIQGVYTRWWGRALGMRTGAGVGAGFVRLPAPLEAAYGTRTPLELGVFLNFRP